MYCVRKFEGEDCDTGRSWDRTPFEFTGRTESECLRTAKSEGWIIRKQGTDICPTCATKRGKK